MTLRRLLNINRSLAFSHVCLISVSTKEVPSVCLFVCLFVYSLAGLCKKFLGNVHEIL